MIDTMECVNERGDMFLQEARRGRLGTADAGDGASPMRERLEDGRCRKTWKKMVEPECEFHPELDARTAG